MALRWGIVSAGKISHDFATGLGTLPKKDHEIVAVAARDEIRAKEFAVRHEVPKFYGSYEELAKDSNIQIVYVGALNRQHYDICVLMLDNGKHVLCEKPLCVNEKQAQKLLDHAKHKKLFLMEAVWSRFFPSYQYVKKQLDDGVLGDIVSVEAAFGFDHKNSERLLKKSLGGGTIIDMGIYTIQISQWAFKKPPINIEASGRLNEDGVDIAMNATLSYEGGGKAYLKTSAVGLLDNCAIIKGTKGKIIIEQFWCPTTIIDIDGKKKEWQLPAGKNETFYPNSVGLRYEAEEVRKCILSGKLDCETVTHAESLILAHIEDEIRKQIGVIYPEDEE